MMDYFHLVQVLGPGDKEPFIHCVIDDALFCGEDPDPLSYGNEEDYFPPLLPWYKYQHALESFLEMELSQTHSGRYLLWDYTHPSYQEAQQVVQGLAMALESMGYKKTIDADDDNLINSIREGAAKGGSTIYMFYVDTNHEITYGGEAYWVPTSH